MANWRGLAKTTLSAKKLAKPPFLEKLDLLPPIRRALLGGKFLGFLGFFQKYRVFLALIKKLAGRERTLAQTTGGHFSKFPMTGRIFG